MTRPASTPKIALGCIADDFTGATDLANNLVRSGLRVVQTIGIPKDRILDVDAIVIALKSRTIAADEAVAQSLAALDALRSQGCVQIYFKVCSTFDSTAQGNIGPVAEALLASLGAAFCCVAPAFPQAGRTVYMGNLFVGRVPLAESGMRGHPLTPMHDSNLVRVMQAQCDGRVGLIDHAVVRAGSDALVQQMRQLRSEGIRFAIVDTISNEDLTVLGRGLRDEPFVVAGSGVGIALAQNYALDFSGAAATRLPPAAGARAVISGSCSQATNEQVCRFIEAGMPAFALDPLQVAAGKDVVALAIDWASLHLGDRPVLVYSSAAPESVQNVQRELGNAAAGAMVEYALAEIAKRLVEQGVRQLVVAGGETSGAVVQALGIDQMRIGQQIDPGVPWCHARSQACGVDLHLALKSGNFGTPDFLLKAFEELE